MSASWRDPKWRYHQAASHANAAAFRQRQRQRMRQAVQLQQEKALELLGQKAQTQQ